MSSKSNHVLEGLLGDRGRARILRLFLHHPQLVLAAGQIAQRTNSPKEKCLRMISQLVKLGVLKRVAINDRKNKKKIKGQKKTGRKERN